MRILFSVFSTLMIFCKESFLILTPAIIFTYIFLEKTQEENQNWIVAIKKHLVELSILVILFVTSVVFVLKQVNTENLGYAGIDGFSQMVNDMKQLNDRIKSENPKAPVFK